jgi:hypothetical protein
MVRTIFASRVLRRQPCLLKPARVWMLDFCPQFCCFSGSELLLLWAVSAVRLDMPLLLALGARGMPLGVCALPAGLLPCFSPSISVSTVDIYLRDALSTGRGVLVRDLDSRRLDVLLDDVARDVPLGII